MVHSVGEPKTRRSEAAPRCSPLSTSAPPPTGVGNRTAISASVAAPTAAPTSRASRQPRAPTRCPHPNRPIAAPTVNATPVTRALAVASSRPRNQAVVSPTALPM